MCSLDGFDVLVGCVLYRVGQVVRKNCVTQAVCYRFFVSVSLAIPRFLFCNDRCDYVCERGADDAWCVHAVYSSRRVRSLPTPQEYYVPPAVSSVLQKNFLSFFRLPNSRPPVRAHVRLCEYEREHVFECTCAQRASCTSHALDTR